MDATPQSFSDYLVFVDESGDHNLKTIDPQFPVFVLLFVIMRKADYVDQVCRDLQRFKLEFWGHDEVVLHEHEIRKPFGQFLFLLQKPLRERFLEGLNQLIQSLPATLVAVVIDKTALATRYRQPVNPYDYAMEAGLERVFTHLQSLRQQDRRTPVIVECRGRREDAELELAFRRVCDGANALRRSFPFDVVMATKASNSAGLQLADLMARPIALHQLRPEQQNRAYEIIESKLRRSPYGKVEGWGLKVLP
ncbi:MAG: DUF3800 domain-containing protein [Nevskia sp.]|nr:DUF3800 domain-containing protein [Nevskia sp.]